MAGGTAGYGDGTSVVVPTGRRPVGWLVAIGALALASLLTLAVLAGLLATRPAAGGQPAYVPVARNAARTATLTFLTVSADHVDADMDRMLALSTGTFRRQYEQQRATLRTAILDNKVRATATVSEVALTRAGPTTATALVVAVGTTRNTSTPKGRTTRNRLRLSLVRQHDRWLVDTLSLE